MHEALAKFLSLEDKTPAPTPLTDSAQLKHFAREAEVNEQFELANKYYKEVTIIFFSSSQQSLVQHPCSSDIDMMLVSCQCLRCAASPTTRCTLVG